MPPAYNAGLSRIFLLGLYISLVSVFKTNGQHSFPFTADSSSDYATTMAFYRALAHAHPQARLLEYGPTDTGKPLHLFVIGGMSSQDARARGDDHCVYMIMNGIHPGEPDGIDASMIFARDLLSGDIDPGLLSNTTICIIPTYNIGGMLNRGCCSRANQDGPRAYGFRGNIRNLDLNRDFVKTDAANTRSFIGMYHEWDPDVFVDTHVSNGADYPYTMTLISTQHNKLHPLVGNFLKEKFTPAVFIGMKDKGDEIAPYMHTRPYGLPPESGIYGFLETPRYSTGYTALFHTLGFVAETHMLKPFPQRVNATYRLLLTLLEETHEAASAIRQARIRAREAAPGMARFPLNWEADTTQYELVPFRGYAYRQKPSNITGHDRGYYDQSSPFETEIRFYDTYHPTTEVMAPEYYILPQAWREVVERLKLSGVQMYPLTSDTVLEAEVYYIVDYHTGSRPYEGRYLHSNVSARAVVQEMSFYRGDLVIPVNQDNCRFVVETLEPEGVDSWFAWGFFDSILQQKEWFSPYVFEEKAEELLKDPELRASFEKQMETDSLFARDSFRQLYFLYRSSPDFEKSLNRYPVARIRKTP